MASYEEFRRLAETAAGDSPTQADWVAYLDAVREPRALLPVIDERYAALEAEVAQYKDAHKDWLRLRPQFEELLSLLAQRTVQRDAMSDALRLSALRLHQKHTVDGTSEGFDDCQSMACFGARTVLALA